MNHPTSNRDVPGLRWHEVPLEEGDDTREEVMRKIEKAIEAVVESVMRPDADVQEAVSGAVAESIAAFALDNSVGGPGQVLRIRPVPERNSLEAEIGGAEMEVPVPLPVGEAAGVVRVDVAEAVAKAVGEEERRTKLTESVKEALASILESKKPDPTKFGISVTAEVEEGESAVEGNGFRDELNVRFSDDLFSVPEFGFTVDTTTTARTQERIGA